MRAKSLLTRLAIVALLALVAPGVMSGTVREAYWLVAQRTAAKVSPPRLVLVGDSLMADAGWNFGPPGLAGWRSVNLAEGGATVSQASAQMALARGFRPGWVLIEVGINDILAGQTAQKIALDYDSLLTGAPSGVRLAVTLIPRGGSIQRNQRIDEANGAIRLIAERHGARVLDLGPIIAPGGAIQPAYTTDGLHFSPAAYDAWSRRLGPVLAQN